MCMCWESKPRLLERPPLPKASALVSAVTAAGFWVRALPKETEISKFMGKEG